MATIKPIEARSVHHIQSGQVIVDLCSVVKELVENSLDAGATVLEIRFKNYGLDSIEVQDNGSGVSEANYESVALKHHTSKLSDYDDLSSLQTFGFRGEALSSLCALSTFFLTTAQANEAPKGRRLDFEVSGKLKSTTVVACPKGTLATVETLFDPLPVRRKELTKNIKREYGKVIGLLHAYACVSINVKITVKNSTSKAKSITVFATNGNATTRDNIANVYGAKTLSGLVALDLDLQLQSTIAQSSRRDAHYTKITVRGHISRPVFGEGRQTPDRQMFFVNGRPCGLPQIAKAMNEVYKSFNVSQSPFIFADFQMDTNAYDVNVSPDKRTILLHDSAALTENLKAALAELFDAQDHTVPQSQIQKSKLPAFKQPSSRRQTSTGSVGSSDSRRSSGSPIAAELHIDSTSTDGKAINEVPMVSSVLHDRFRHPKNNGEKPTQEIAEANDAKLQESSQRRAEKVTERLAELEKKVEAIDDDDDDDIRERTAEENRNISSGITQENSHVREFNQRMSEQQINHATSLSRSTNRLKEAVKLYSSDTQDSSHESPNVVQTAFHRMRPAREKLEVATITVGDKTTTTLVGSQDRRSIWKRPLSMTHNPSTTKRTRSQEFSKGLRRFGAPGMQTATEEEDDESDGVAGEAVENESEAESSAEVESEDDRSGGSTGDKDVESPADDDNRGDDDGARISVDDEEHESDPDYFDEATQKADEEARVARLIRAAEEKAANPSEDNVKRANKVLTPRSKKELTANLVTKTEISLQQLQSQMHDLRANMFKSNKSQAKTGEIPDDQGGSEEERLSLTVSKEHFAGMHIVGQFNLGFILAVRKSANSDDKANATGTDDQLFIIDQHASDEKFNFERLQAETTVSNQNLVRPLLLDLTAVEEEIVFENVEALEKNGFEVEVDTTGDKPVGQRCRLISLPLSKEVIFDTRDLEELIHLLAESPTVSSGSIVPRPTKVRKMFAMRACRSSIMIGKSLSKKQMSAVLAHMGMIDKPWNCPHGRPTMRHLAGLDGLKVWQEGDGISAETLEHGVPPADTWRWYGR